MQLKHAMVGAVLLAAAVGLTGCSGTDQSPTQADPSTVNTSTSSSAEPSPSATASPTETETPYVPTLGETVTEDQVQAVKDAGYAAYQTTDGSYVVVDPHQDLPDTVKADIATRAGTSGKADTSRSTDPAVLTKSVNDQRAAKAAAASVGKTLVVIVHYAELDENGGVHNVGFNWGVVGVPPATPPHSIPTKAAAMAAAEAWVAAQADPTAYVIVDTTGD